MKVALIGNGLTNLVLAKVLANKNIFVSMHYEDNKKSAIKVKAIVRNKKYKTYLVNEIFFSNKLESINASK